MPILEALGHAVPGPPVLQRDVRRRVGEALEVLAPHLLEKLDVFESVQIDKRHFARPIDWYLESHGYEERNAVYVEVGLQVLEEAARRALDAAQLDARDVDGIVFVSTTGLSTPSLDARLKNRMGLRDDVDRVPVWGWGCAGGVAGLNMAADLARAHPEKRYLMLCLELCSLNFNLHDMSMRGLVATTLFADGAAAAIVSGDSAWAAAHGSANRGGRNGPGKSAPRDAGSSAALGRLGAGLLHTWPDTEDVMGWDVLDEGLRVVLSRRIPGIVETRLQPVVERYLKQHQMTPDRHVLHPGGTKVIEGYASGLGLRAEQLRTARDTMREYGNMSSPTVFFALQRALDERPLSPGENALLAALGPGFTASLGMLSGLEA